MEGARLGVDGCGRRCGLNASLRGEIFRKLWLKGLQVEMIVGERGKVVGGQRSCTQHVSGLVSNMLRCGLKYFQEIGVEGAADGDDSRGKGKSCGRTKVVYEACFRVSLKHASLWADTFSRMVTPRRL